MLIDPKPILVDVLDIEDGDIFKDHLGQRVRFPMRSDGGMWFVFDTRARLIACLALDAQVEVLRAPKDVSGESAVGNDAVSDRAADPPSSDTHDWTREPIEPPGRMHDDDVFVERIGWVSAQFAAELPMVRANLARLDDGQRVCDDTPPRGITRPFYLVQP